MKIFTLLGTLLISASALSQIEKPLLTGVCEGQGFNVESSLINGEIRISLQGKNANKRCVLAIDNATMSHRPPTEKLTFYFRPSGCDGRASGDKRYNQGPIIDRGFLEVAQSGRMAEGMIHVLKEGRPMTCKYYVKSWKRLQELAESKRNN